jgi:hypothetical protein
MLAGFQDRREAGRVLAGRLGAYKDRRRDPKKEMDEDLLRMKTLIETGNPPHDAAQPDPVPGASQGPGQGQEAAGPAATPTTQPSS